ncbi:hypothetical protein KQI08_01760 [Paraeggerthella hongkongensis]|uniref:hypothetical protein n=1 Tax=Paraeggerthella TaxID=651554 RepID=UPI0011C07714|nr:MULTISPECIES: hypothetical protein [Paraeggerthella]MBU5404644.1 hypothetical protein [Paraeggerthella hongkongensis]MCD2432340.1 hypothetical protein [Paraeggerthella hominis]
MSMVVPFSLSEQHEKPRWAACSFVAYAPVAQRAHERRPVYLKARAEGAGNRPQPTKNIDASRKPLPFACRSPARKQAVCTGGSNRCQIERVLRRFFAFLSKMIEGRFSSCLVKDLRTRFILD